MIDSDRVAPRTPLLPTLGSVRHLHAAPTPSVFSVSPRGRHQRVLVRSHGKGGRLLTGLWTIAGSQSRPATAVKAKPFDGIQKVLRTRTHPVRSRSRSGCVVKCRFVLRMGVVKSLIQNPAYSPPSTHLLYPKGRKLRAPRLRALPSVWQRREAWRTRFNAAASTAPAHFGFTDYVKERARARA